MLDLELDTLQETERRHFTRCEECGQFFDMRDLDQVVFHCFTPHRVLPDMPRSGWARLADALPAEPLPDASVMMQIRQLRSGMRVYVEYSAGPERIAGWGTLWKCAAVGGWEVEFENGSAVGMSAAEMKLRCMIPAPAHRAAMGGLSPCRRTGRKTRRRRV